MNRPVSLAALFLCGVAALAFGTARADAPLPNPSPSASPTAEPTPKTPYDYVSWREVGPSLPGGRVAAVVGVSDDPNLYYVGAAGGGVWKTVDGGATWDPVFAKEDVASIGSIAIDPKNHDTVYVGTGETNPRNDVIAGNGVYKTTDGGKTWTNLGLKETKQISSVLIDPQNPNIVVVGALGDIFKDSHDRGVYRSEDGGKTWTQTLFVGPMSGVSDMAMDPKDPNVLYAGMWQFRRMPWNFQSGGPDDGLYKSTDGGKTWKKLTGSGLPAGTTGRIAIAIAPSNPKRVYAIIESKDGILFRSDDAGASWTMVSDDTLVDQRPFYFSHIAVDPKDADKVYAVSEFLALSKDGGKKFTEIGRGNHVDHHAIWIDPSNPERIIIGEDGGYAITVDDGTTWSFGRQIPIGEVYRVGLSNENPYTICGGWQDNSAWCFPSNSLDPSGILNSHVISVNGGDGEWAVPDPVNPDWIWSDSETGNITVFNKKTLDSFGGIPYIGNGVQAYDISQAKYRFNWESPISFAPWNGNIGYLGGNVVFQSTDHGISWKAISPDLTRNDKSRQQPTGGPLVHDVSSAENFDTLLDIEPSTIRRGEIWVGSDDGLIHVTLDSGKTWKDVTPSGAPMYGRVATVAPSYFDPGTAYAIFDNHYLGDFAPYVYVTHDYGKSWSSLAGNLGKEELVRTIHPDSRNPNILYLGTETGIKISFDSGTTWQDFKMGIPTVSVRDIRIQPEFNDLVIATHGRSVYVFDDLAGIQGLPQAMAQGAALFTPRTSYEYNLHSNDEGTYTDFTGENPPYGVMITYYQKTVSPTPPKLDVLDALGHAVLTLQGTHKVGGKEQPYLPNKIGLNRYTWGFQTNGPVKWTGAARERYQGPNFGPSVPPGRYTIRLTIDGRTFTQPAVVKPDPRTKMTQAEFDESYQFALKYSAKYSVIDTMLNNLDTAKKAIAAAQTAAKKTNNAALSQQLDTAMAAHDTIFNVLTADYHNDEDSIQRPGFLREDIGNLTFVSGGIISPPLREFASKIDVRYPAAVTQYNDFVTKTIQPLSDALKAANMKPIDGVSTVKP